MNAPEVTVIDYGAGNLLSVRRGLEHCGAKVKLTDKAEEILTADRVVLPGVGAFANAMNALNNLGLISAILEVGKKGVPLLGICLGMQLLLEESEEFGLSKGLGIIPGRVVPIPNETISGEIQKIPHIGWNKLQISNSLEDWRGSLLQDISSGESTYFVHSYMAVPDDQANRIADCVYGGRSIAAVIGKDSVTGCQFHPEKSGEVGLKVLRRFIKQ